MFVVMSSWLLQWFAQVGHPATWKSLGISHCSGKLGKVRNCGLHVMWCIFTQQYS